MICSPNLGPIRMLVFCDIINIREGDKNDESHQSSPVIYPVTGCFITTLIARFMIRIRSQHFCLDRLQPGFELFIEFLYFLRHFFRKIVLFGNILFKIVQLEGFTVIPFKQLPVACPDNTVRTVRIPVVMREMPVYRRPI